MVGVFHFQPTSYIHLFTNMVVMVLLPQYDAIVYRLCSDVLGLNFVEHVQKLQHNKIHWLKMSLYYTHIPQLSRLLCGSASFDIKVKSQHVR